IHRSNASIDQRRRRRLANVVADGAEHHRQLLRPVEIVDARARLVDDLERVYPDVALGMPLGLLRTSRERQQLGQQLRDHAEVQGEGESNRRTRGKQQLFELAPDALRRQVVERDAATERSSGLVEREAEPGRELHRAEYAQAVVGEGFRIDHPQQALFEIAPAVEGIEELAGQRILRDGIDREIAAPRGFVDRHLRIAGDDEAAMAATGLRITPRQRDVETADLVDLKAFANRFDAPEPLEHAAQTIGRQAEDLEVDVVRFDSCSIAQGNGIAAKQPIAHPAADDERAAARVADRAGDRHCLLERAGHVAHLTGLRPKRCTKRSVKAGASAFMIARPRDHRCGYTSATGLSIARAIASATVSTGCRGPNARLTGAPVSPTITSKNSVSVETG